MDFARKLLGRRWCDREPVYVGPRRGTEVVDLVPGDATGGRVDWRFTTADARFKLKRLYLKIHE